MPSAISMLSKSPGTLSDTQSSVGNGLKGLTYLFKLIKTQFELTQFFPPDLMLPFFTSDLKTFDFIDANADKKPRTPQNWFSLQWQLVHLV